MMEEKKIWLASRGRCSDYKVYGVFSTKEKAQEFCDHFNSYNDYGDNYDVEETVLDPAIPQIRKGFKQYSVWMDRDGKGYASTWDWPEDAGLRLIDTKRRPRIQRLYGYVWAESDQHALKIANEKRAMLIANSEWVYGPAPEPVDTDSMFE